MVQNLNRTNVSVVANALKGAFESAEHEITRNISYRLDLKSTGITAFRYRQMSPDGMHPQVEGEERYVGDLMLNDYSIFMNSTFVEPNPEDSLLDCSPCSPYGPYDYLKEIDAAQIFDCCKVWH